MAMVVSRHEKYAVAVYLLVTVLFFSLALPYANGQELEPLLFLVNGELVPIAYEENGIVKGVVIDIAEALGKKIDRAIEIRAMDWPTAQAQVISGEADALLQINCTPSREEIFSFSGPLLPSEFVIVRRHDQPEIKRLADLEDKRVAVEAGGFAYDLLRGHERIETVLVLSVLQGLEFLQMGDIDALVADRWIAEYALAQSGISGIQIAREPLEVSYSQIAVKKGNAELLELINDGLQEIEGDGTLDKILADWRGKNVVYLTEEQIMRTVVGTVITILFAISFISIFFVVKLKRLNHELEAKVAFRTQELAAANEHLQLANAELERQSTLDQLTQIPNRRGFESLFERAWGLSLRYQQPLSLVIIDVDRFKSVNDQYGHLMGDQYLKELATVLRETVRRPGDAVARLAGDEFVALLLNTTENGAVHVAEAMRSKVEALSTQEAHGVEFSASFGIATLIPDNDMLPTDLIALADQALYKAKEGGRNKVVAASEI